LIKQKISISHNAVIYGIYIYINGLFIKEITVSTNIKQQNLFSTAIIVRTIINN